MALLVEFTDAELARLGERFRRAKPFPHLVLENVLSIDPAQADVGLPDPSWPHWRKFTDTYQKEKHTCAEIRVIPEPWAGVVREASQPPFLRRLEAMTGVKGLIPDPYLDGGGLHASGAGGVLAPHTDFHLNERLGLYRALNVLIYLNPGWREEDGGQLELYAAADRPPAVRVVPAFGTLVVFLTNDASIHGFTRPVATGKWRQSIALYYYVSRKSAVFSGDANTHWKTRDIAMTGLRRRLHDTLIFTSRGVSKLAHLIDPNRR
jgi:hypothetical protein